MNARDALVRREALEDHSKRMTALAFRHNRGEISTDERDRRVVYSWSLAVDYAAHRGVDLNHSAGGAR